MEIFKKSIVEHIETVRLLSDMENSIEQFVHRIVSLVENGGTVFICGNGGSAADAQHIAAEFTGRFVKEREPLPAIALTTDTSALTAIANDYGYDQVFVRQVKALAKKGDIVIGISTSGNSESINLALEAANKNGAVALGLTGRDGGRMLEICEKTIVVPSQITARIQECHILLGHIICEACEEQLG
jgi:D-sedoheptulose 7-phosphate isomerase